MSDFTVIDLEPCNSVCELDKIMETAAVDS